VSESYSLINTSLLLKIETREEERRRETNGRSKQQQQQQQQDNDNTIGTPFTKKE